ncbi:MAG: YcaO-like family protein [Nocardioides sp.]
MSTTAPITTPSPPALPELTHLDIRSYLESESLVVGADGALFHVTRSPEELTALLRRCDGLTSSERIADGDPEVSELLAVLGDAGVLRDRAAASTARPVVLAGDPELVALTAGLLEDALSVPCQPDADPAELARLVADHDAVLLHCRRNEQVDQMLALDRAFAEAKRSWVSFFVDGQTAYIGPTFVPGRTSSYTDLIERRRCVIDLQDVFDSLLREPSENRPLPPAGQLSPMIGVAVDEVGRVAADINVRTHSVELELRPGDLAVKRHPVLPMPSRPLEGDLLISAPADVELLVSERTGIIARTRVIEHHPDVPARLHTVQAHCASMGRIDPEWANDVICGGSTVDDLAQARASAIGEAVERYCGNYMGQNDLRLASYDEIVAGGEHAVDPDSLVLYSEATYDAPGCPFVRFGRDLQVQWVKGRSLTRDCDAWLPVTLVYVNWLAGEFEGHPLTNYMNFSGVAAGRELDHAIVSGIEELVERDATMIWWMNGYPLPALRQDGPGSELAAFVDSSARAAGQRAWAVPLPNEFGIPVVAGVVHHTEHDYYTIGFATRPSVEEATFKAWTEAFTLQEGSRDLERPDSLIQQAVEWGMAAYAGLKEHRADRRYLDDYRADFKDVTDLMCQQQIFLDRRAVERVNRFVDTPRTVDPASVPALADRSLASYRERLESRGFEIFFADLTTQDVAAAGMHGVRVVVPGLVPNFPAAFPTLGRGRVQQMAVELGWREAPLPEADLNYWPVPHA